MQLPSAVAVGGEGEIPPTFTERHFKPESIRSFAECVGNARYAESVGVPFVERQEPHGRTLAVVGAGPSVVDHVDALKAWDGDIWAINGAFDFLKSQGIESTFFAIDPQEHLADYRPERALLGACVHPRLFDNMEGKPVQAFYPAGMEPEGYQGLIIHGGGSAVVYTPLLALWLGYRNVTLFGCEGSLSRDPNDGGVSHVNENQCGDLMIVSSHGQRFWLAPQMLMQCERLAAIIRQSPHLFREMSGGLLRAMVENGLGYEVIGATEKLARTLWPESVEL